VTTWLKVLTSLFTAREAQQLGARAFFNYYFLDNQELLGRYQPNKVKIPRIGEAWAIYLNCKLPENEEQTTKK
jgi:hypothetical protein